MNGSNINDLISKAIKIAISIDFKLPKKPIFFPLSSINVRLFTLISSEDILNSDSNKKFSLDGHYDIFPEGLYRSKWYRPHTSRNVLFGLGIHGQWIWIDFDKELSFVCLSSEPKPIMKNNIDQMSDIFSQITNQLV